MEIKLIQQFKTKEGTKYEPVHVTFEGGGYLFTALRGPDDNSESPKELGTSIIRHVLGFCHGIVCCPNDTHNYLYSLRDGEEWDSHSKMNELMGAQTHYSDHLKRAFLRLHEISKGQDKEYFGFLNQLWQAINDTRRQPAIRKKAIKKELQKLWDFLENADYLRDEHGDFISTRY